MHCRHALGVDVGQEGKLKENEENKGKQKKTKENKRKQKRKQSRREKIIKEKRRRILVYQCPVFVRLFLPAVCSPLLASSAKGADEVRSAS